MFGKLHQRLGSSYPVVLFMATRLFAVVAGGLCIAYVNWTLDLHGVAREIFFWAAWGAICLSVVVTGALCLWLTRHLRAYYYLSQFRRAEDMKAALAESILLPRRMAAWEMLVDPWVSIFPICLVLQGMRVSATVQAQVCVAGFLGLAGIILGTFLWLESGMKTVTIDLLRTASTGLDCRVFPAAQLGRRMMIGFGTIILMTAIMISGLSLHRSYSEGGNAEWARQLQKIALITAIALAVGLAYAQLLSNSISRRITSMLLAMQAVEGGDLNQQLLPTGTDEIDRLAHQFNGMVGRLARSDADLRQLNSRLEQKVADRTQELRSSLAQLQELDQLKTQFFANVSHELRTPLLMILSPISQLQKAESSSSASQRDLLEIAELNSRRLLTLINQLLEFSSIESGKLQLRPVRLDVCRLMEQLVQAARPLAQQRGLRLDLATEKERHCIAADAERLETVFRNLLSNAIKFTPAGGKITVRATVPQKLEDARGIRIEVSDTGPGILPEERSRLFQRFCQLDGSASREFSGTGIGLALAKELVEAHGGVIDVISTPGNGATFFVELPEGDQACVDELPEVSTANRVIEYRPFTDLEVAKSTEAPRPSTNEERPVILLVDDNGEVRQLIRRLLESEYQIVEAEDGAEGLATAQLVLPDLILSDVMMPRMNGHEFCRAIKDNPITAAIPFVMITARARTEMKVAGLNSGADDYLCKPFEEAELFARLRSLLRLRRMHQAVEERNGELQQALSERERLQRQLVQSEKLISLGQLVAGLAHEVNNAINPVCSGSAVLRKRLERLRDMSAVRHTESGSADPESELLTKTLQLTDIIGQGANRTAQIVEDMKRFGHPGSTESVEFDLNRTINITLQLLRLQYRHVVLANDAEADALNQIRVFYSAQEFSTGTGPYGQLDQVLLNILGNAVQALGESGAIRVTTTETDAAWEVTIADNGPGIPESIRDRIFDPFFTTKPPGQGTGLGLSISHSIVTGIGGELHCRSEVGVGTEFRITIPRPQSLQHSSNAKPTDVQPLKRVPASTV